ncbi:hypothetical protein GCM10018781_22200 [Kitasatospora indigofera]|uniref:Uncharacterized protein n=1 Tax=Kitasatospora indigofera TaxID=67307 RepID=A0A919KNM6_9ACTN|nr:hypothetical protein GCM10018781_22200 [Kitasatospora indigofera]
MSSATWTRRPAGRPPGGAPGLPAVGVPAGASPPAVAVGAAPPAPGATGSSLFPGPRPVSDRAGAAAGTAARRTVCTAARHPPMVVRRAKHQTLTEPARRPDGQVRADRPWGLTVRREERG